MYAKYIKRILDFILSLIVLIVLSPVLLVVAILVRIKLGSPIIFKQQRPGKDEKIFTLYKFRTMTDKKDENGNLLPDSERLTKFGKVLRSTSLPRPLLVEYLPLYSEEQKHRHDVRPGLTGLAQVSGRNSLSWEEKFNDDLQYIKHITFFDDMKIIFMTVAKVFKREGIAQEGNATMEKFTGNREKSDKTNNKENQVNV